MYRRRRRLKGLNWSQTYNFDDDPSTDQILKVVKKGHEHEINMAELENLVKYLVKYCNYKIRDLPKEVRSRYNTFLTYVNTFHGHHYYPELLNIINKHYRPSEDLRPHTIGAYLAGCTQKTDITNQACSPLCAGNIKYQNSGSDFCSYPVFTAEWNIDKNNFTFSHTSDDDFSTSTAIIYVPFVTKLSFPGFNTEEKEYLKSRGVEKVRIYGTINYHRYVKLYGDPDIDIDSVKSRAGVINVKTPVKATSALIIGIIVFVILTLLLLGYFYYQSRPRRRKR